MGLPILSYLFLLTRSSSVTTDPSEKTWPGNRCLQSSHSSAFQQYVLTQSPSFFDLLELSHSRRHPRWMWLMVPAHLHGDINGSSFSFSSPRQILHTFYSYASLAFWINISFLACACFCLSDLFLLFFVEIRGSGSMFATLCFLVFGWLADRALCVFGATSILTGGGLNHRVPVLMFWFWKFYWSIIGGMLVFYLSLSKGPSGAYGSWSIYGGLNCISALV